MRPVGIATYDVLDLRSTDSESALITLVRRIMLLFDHACLFSRRVQSGESDEDPLDVDLVSCSDETAPSASADRGPPLQYCVDAALSKAKASQLVLIPLDGDIKPFDYAPRFVTLSQLTYTALFIGVARSLPPPLTIRTRFIAERHGMLLSWTDDPHTFIYFDVARHTLSSFVHDESRDALAALPGVPATYKVRKERSRVASSPR